MTRATKWRDPRLAGALDEALEQGGGDAAPLPGIADDHRDLGQLGLGAAHVARNADQVAGLGVDCGQRLVVGVVDLGQVGEVALREPSSGRKKRR